VSSFYSRVRSSKRFLVRCFWKLRSENLRFCLLLFYPACFCDKVSFRASPVPWFFRGTYLRLALDFFGAGFRVRALSPCRHSLQGRFLNRSPSFEVEPRIARKRAPAFLTCVLDHFCVEFSFPTSWTFLLAFFCAEPILIWCRSGIPSAPLPFLDANGMMKAFCHLGSFFSAYPPLCFSLLKRRGAKLEGALESHSVSRPPVAIAMLVIPP